MQPHPFSLPSFAQPWAGRKSSEAGLSFPLCCSSWALPGRATCPVPQHLPLSPWQCQGVLINIRSPVMDAAAGKHLDQQITGSPVQALHTQELHTCIGKLLGKNTGVPSRWGSSPSNQLQSDTKHKERGKNQCKEDLQTQSPGTQPHGATASPQPLYLPPSEQSSVHRTSPLLAKN